MSHGDFCRAINFTNAREVEAVRILRRVVEVYCQVPAGTLYPEDDPKVVLSLPPGGWDDIHVVFSLEDEFDTAMPTSFEPARFAGRFFCIHWAGASNMGEWFAETARRLAEIESISLTDDKSRGDE